MCFFYRLDVGGCVQHCPAGSLFCLVSLLFSNLSASVFLLFDFVAQSFACLLWAGLELFGVGRVGAVWFSSVCLPRLSLLVSSLLLDSGWTGMGGFWLLCVLLASLVSLIVHLVLPASRVFLTHDNVIWYVGAFCLGPMQGYYITKKA